MGWGVDDLPQKDDRLIIPGPVDTFRGATNEDPWTLEIRYDY